MGIYTAIYNLIVQYIFGTVEAGSFMELASILLSACACIFVFALPFVLVWKIIKMF